MELFSETSASMLGQTRWSEIFVVILESLLSLFLLNSHSGQNPSRVNGGIFRCRTLFDLSRLLSLDCKRFVETITH